jgi:CRP-like cAMP-binding protein
VADEDTRSVRERGEEVLGEFAQALLENPLFSQVLTTAFEAREHAVEAQRSAMGALDISSASEVERLNRRLRSLSDRLEAVEDSLDSLTRDVGARGERAGAEASAEG